MKRRRQPRWVEDALIAQREEARKVIMQDPQVYGYGPSEPSTTNARGLDRSPVVVSLDTLRCAERAVEQAQTLVAQTGADQYQATFAQADGTLGGKVVMLQPGHFIVDFGLMGEKPHGSE